MSDEAEKVKKRCEIALAVATIASMDVELEAARAKVRTIKRHLVINSLMLNAAVLSGRRATRYSVILLALVDHKYRFGYTNVGSPGRCHDAHVFLNSILARAIQEPALQSPTICVGTSLVPPLILCDQAFPLTPNLMKPFPGSNHTPEESNFNYELSKTRRIVENAFGRLKARFRFVMKRMECDISNVPIVIRACCVLNNICEHFNDSVSQQWLNEAELQNTVYHQPLHTTGMQVGCGRDVQDALVHYFQLHGDHCSRALSWVSDLSLDSKHPKKRCSSLKKGHVVAAEPVPCSRSSFLQ
ncbi:uncharacterized protein LOC125945817 [Dermacentor silvarum]|uniref:uncharacterized protein LOC125945817 n=1 Tax=Dermacentor silvarum TaxID=543639 RepID=UPI00210181AC|nr:uncharacterized protein LOC125945817 [Dermacentor silvarum]